MVRVKLPHWKTPMAESVLKPQGGDLVITLDDGMVLKSRVREVRIDNEVTYDDVFSEYSDYPATRFMSDERYTLTAEFDGTYTIYAAPTKLHKVMFKVTDVSIKGIVKAQKEAGAPDTASVRVKSVEPDGRAMIVFEWEA